MNKAAQAYFQTKVNTTDQGQLLLLLYDGALKFLQQAREKMIEKDYAAKGILISKVIDIINELTNTLNLEKGGSLAENLNNLYFLCTTRLLQANLKMNVEQLDNVADILSGLRSAYAEIIETPEARRASAQIASKLNVDASVGQRAAIQTHHQPVGMPSAMGQMQARNAYATMQRSVPAPATPSAAVPAQPTAPKSGIAAGMAAPAAPVASQAPGDVSTPGSQPVAQQVAFTSPQSSSAAPVTPVAPAVAPTAPATSTAPVAAAAPTAPTAPASNAAPAAATAATPTAPKAGFGVKGFAYNKAFGK